MKTADLAESLHVSERIARGYKSGEYQVPCHNVARYCQLMGKPLIEVRPDLYQRGLRIAGSVDSEARPVTNQPGPQ